MTGTPCEDWIIMSTYAVGIVGAGRVGAVLGAALARAGHRIVAASGVSAASKDRIVKLLPGVPALPADEVAAAAELLIIAVPDDTLAPLVAGLADTQALRPGQIVAHTSGAHGIGVLAPAVKAGAWPLAVHPVMTFTGTAADLDRLPGVSFGVTAPPALKAVATRLVADLGGASSKAGRLAADSAPLRPLAANVEWIAEERRPLYHAALAHGANHLVTLVNEALDRLRDAGVRHPERVLGPLLHAALDNTLRLGDAALTGPVSRGDAGTVAGHLKTLEAVAPESVAAYRALARRTADRAIASGRLRARDAEPLLDVLAGEGRQVRA